VANLSCYVPEGPGDQEVKYDMQILADRIEFCWLHLRGIGTLENSLWGYDGQGIRLWLNALTLEANAPPIDDSIASPENVKESVNIPLNFYPLSVLMDKGIIIGAEHESVTRANLSFTMFRHVTSSHLFMHHILMFHLSNDQVKEAVLFASHYQHLVFFAHALEILLHCVIEEDAHEAHHQENQENGDFKSGNLLPAAIEFLDHFDDALDVVVGCARKIEMTRWPRLFDIVGDPKTLFETCLSSDRLKTASSYLLLLHNIEELDGTSITGDAVRLLKAAVVAKDWQLCREILRFLHSVDDTGSALRRALEEAQIVEASNGVISVNGNGIH